jgi:large subunit ribosomal protein L28
MSRVCELTGKKAMTGNYVSFSNKKNKRKFNVNLLRKRFYVAAEDKWVTLRLSAAALKTVNKKVIDAVLADARSNGFTTK